GAIRGDQVAAERRQRRATAAGPAHLGDDDGPPERVSDVVDQLPRPAVGHAHRTRGGGDRAELRDPLEQIDLAGTDAAARHVDAEAERDPAAWPAIVRPHPLPRPYRHATVHANRLSPVVPGGRLLACPAW